jgi:hypothetical protein
MKTRTWLPPVVFLAASLPTVLLLHALEIGGDYRLLIGIAVGALATAVVQTRLVRRDGDGPGR